MTETQHPSPVKTVHVFDVAATVKATDLHHLTFISNMDVVINRIPVSFVAHLHYSEHYGSWLMNQYSADVRRHSGTAPATENQILKLSHELSKVAAALPAAFHLKGQEQHLGRIVERSQERVDSVREQLVEQLTYLRADTMAYEAAVLAR